MEKLQRVLLTLKIISEGSLNDYKINFWNPLTYLFMIFYIPIQLIVDGTKFLIKSIKKIN